MKTSGRRSAILALSCAAGSFLFAATGMADSPAPILEGRAILPADTLAPGPPSGSMLGTAPINGVTPPFPSQPVQGFSAVIETGEPGEYWAMPDNGYGSKASSPDFLLRAYRIKPDFKTAEGGTGSMGLLGTFIQLRDPDHQVPFPIVNGATAERLLTGGDFDIESMRIDRNGDLWFGDEFGPWLLHADETGRVREPPIPLPGVKSPNNQTLLPGEAATLPNSRGFEGMAVARNGRRLLPMLEGALVADTDKRRRIIYEFDIPTRSYTGRTWQYRTDAPGYSTPELVAIGEHSYLVIERDSLVGAAAIFKKVFAVNLNREDCDGFLIKREVLDMMNIGDPALISLPGNPGDVGLGATFTFPYETIEALLPLDDERLLILNDNNYPFSANRSPGVPDYNEAIVVRVQHLDGNCDCRE
jgi:glycerophosphoryl diester phosphodiesterase